MTDRYRFSDHFPNQSIAFRGRTLRERAVAHGFTDNTQFDFGRRTVFGDDIRIGNGGLNESLGALVKRAQIATHSAVIMHAPPFPGAAQRLRRTT